MAAGAAYPADPSQFVGRPKLPGSTEKEPGRVLLPDDLHAISRRALKRGLLAPAGRDMESVTAHNQVNHARLVPRTGCSGVERVSEPPERPPPGDPKLLAAVALGVATLAALTANTAGLVPRLVNGRPIKSTNQFSNQRKAALQAALGHAGTTARSERLPTRRTRRLNHSLPAASTPSSAVLGAAGSGTLVMGKHRWCKQAVDLGQRTTQTFVQLPHARFIQLLPSKAPLAGMAVVLQAARSTSKASFLDGDDWPVDDPATPQQYAFSGKRVARAL